MKVCQSCAANETEAKFPDRSRVCWDCTIELRRERPVLLSMPQKRQSAMAAQRYRAKQDQLDLVDLLHR